jgi:hypothetical protein
VPSDDRGCRAGQPGGERDKSTDEGLGLSLGLGLCGGMAEMLHHGVRVDAAQWIRHALAFVLKLSFPFALQLVLAFFLALTEQSPDDAAKAAEELLALLLGFVLVLAFELAFAEQSPDDTAEAAEELLALLLGFELALQLCLILELGLELSLA